MVGTLLLDEAGKSALEGIKVIVAGRVGVGPCPGPGGSLELKEVVSR